MFGCGRCSEFNKCATFDERITVAAAQMDGQFCPISLQRIGREEVPDQDRQKIHSPGQADDALDPGELWIAYRPSFLSFARNEVHL